MENRFYIKELDSYQKASDLSKERMGTNPNYDLELLPTKQMQEECGSSCNTEVKTS